MVIYIKLIYFRVIFIPKLGKALVSHYKTKEQHNNKIPNKWKECVALKFEWNSIKVKYIC